MLAWVGLDGVRHPHEIFLRSDPPIFSNKVLYGCFFHSVIERFRIMEARRMKKLYRNKADDDDEELHNISQSWGNYVRKKATFLDYLNDKKCDAGKKLEIIDEAAKIILPLFAIKADLI